MSEKAPVMVFSGTNSRYLAEKICASLDCPLGKYEHHPLLLMVSLLFPMKSQFVAHMYSWFNPPSLIPTI